MVRQKEATERVALAATKAARDLALAARRRHLDVARRHAAELVRRETELRNRIMRNLRLAGEKAAERKREELRGKCGGTRLRSAVVTAVGKGAAGGNKSGGADR